MSRTVSAARKPLPCSLAQKRFWFLEQFEPGNPALNIGVRWRLEGTVSDAAIATAFQTLLARHEILRTTFVEIDGEPHQLIADRIDTKVSFVDLTRLQPDVRQTEAERISAQDARRSIDIRTDAPIRLTSLRLDERNILLLLSMHHIASDGVSVGIIAHEFGMLIAAEMKGRDISLPALELQFADYALWQADMVESGAFEDAGAYWSRKLGDMSYFEVPGDRPRPPKLGTESDFRFRLMAPDVVAAFEAAPMKFGRTLFDVSTSALARMLHAWTGRTDISIGTQVAGRDDVMLEPIVGLFINTVVLRFDMAAAETARELVAHVGSVIDDAIAHRQFPFEMLVQRLNPPRDPSRTPLFSVNYTLIRPVIRSERYDDISLVSLPSQPTGAQYDLTFFLVKRADGWRLTCESSRALYETSTVDRMLEMWEAVLREMLQRPDATLQARRPSTIAAATETAVASTDAVEKDSDIVEQIRAIWSDVLKQPVISGSTHFFEAGG
ncbi:MAG TPA: condensation domain-containing protein, partial [Hyphomicrobiaceae bacterium]|nr:condensation domain-containing protein [Hyphomicrobiaceae bacterium]